MQDNVIEFRDKVVISQSTVQEPGEVTAKLADWTPEGGYMVLTDAVYNEFYGHVEHLNDGDVIGTAVVRGDDRGKAEVVSLDIDDAYYPDEDV